MKAMPALRSRNYRLFFAGQLISLIGTWMQQVAMIWLAYRLTDSVAMLGLVGFISQIPILLFSVLAGVWNDRLDRRRLLMWTQFLSLLQALALFGLTATNLITPTALLALAFLLGCINAVDLPARQAFVAQLVTDRADLPNAIGLNSLLMNSARFVGPTLAGLIVASAGEAACFLVNALSYLAVLAALAALRVAPRPVRPQPALTALRAGLTYAFSHPQIRLLLFMVAGFSFFVTPYAVLLPVFARDIFQGGAQTYGFLLGSAGSGALAAALFLALRGGRRGVQHEAAGLDRLVAHAMLASGIALAAFALTPAIALAFPLLTALGFCVVISVAGSNTLIQMVVEEDYRGRVMAIFSAAFLGIAPLGSLAIGAVGAAAGVRPTLLLCGLLACGLGMTYRRRLTTDR
ncbi:MAG: MFS transporter [Rhodocyclaceae bacterium]|jgi:MFS family permease|nr:MFS transporter [Rhodocyclaceae bacterium]